MDRLPKGDFTLICNVAADGSLPGLQAQLRDRIKPGRKPKVNVNHDLSSSDSEDEDSQGEDDDNEQNVD